MGKSGELTVRSAAAVFLSQPVQRLDRILIYLQQAIISYNEFDSVSFPKKKKKKKNLKPKIGGGGRMKNRRKRTNH